MNGHIVEDDIFDEYMEEPVPLHSTPSRKKRPNNLSSMATTTTTTTTDTFNKYLDPTLDNTNNRYYSDTTSVKSEDSSPVSKLQKNNNNVSNSNGSANRQRSQSAGSSYSPNMPSRHSNSGYSTPLNTSTYSHYHEDDDSRKRCAECSFGTAHSRSHARQTIASKIKKTTSPGSPSTWRY